MRTKRTEDHSTTREVEDVVDDITRAVYAHRIGSETHAADDFEDFVEFRPISYTITRSGKLQRHQPPGTVVLTVAEYKSRMDPTWAHD
jgi:hypothetical protein